MKNRKIGSGSRFIAIESISLIFQWSIKFPGKDDGKAFHFHLGEFNRLLPCLRRDKVRSEIVTATRDDVERFSPFSFLNEKLKNGAEKIGIATYVGGWGVWRKNKGSVNKMKWRRPHPKIKWRSEKIGSAIGRATSQTSRAWFFSVFLSARDQTQKRKKERKIRSGFDCLLCLPTSPGGPCYFFASPVLIFGEPFFLSIFLFCFSYLPFYCAAAIAKLVCFFFNPQTGPPVEYKRRREKMKMKSWRFPHSAPAVFLLLFSLFKRISPNESLSLLWRCVIVIKWIAFRLV